MARSTTNSTLTRPIYATLGATDRAVEAVRDSVSDFQSRLTEIDPRPQALRERAVEIPSKVQTFLEEYDVAYDQLVDRGDALVRRIRRQKSTQDTVKSARTASSKAKTTATQATKAGKSTAKSAQGAAKSTSRTAKDAASSTAKSAKSGAKGTSTTARRQSKAPQGSAKATSTSATKTAKSAAKATADAAKKVGD
jgi:hypothetical protein